MRQRKDAMPFALLKADSLIRGESTLAVVCDEDFDDVAARLEGSIAANHLAIPQVHDFNRLLGARGITLDLRCRVYEVCNAHRTAQLITLDAGLAYVPRMVPALAGRYTPYAAENGMRLKSGVDAGTLRLSSDGRVLHRLLSNLLVNTIKHLQASLVVLRAAPMDAVRPQAGVQFIVVDDGVGVDEAARQSLNRVLAGEQALAPAYERSGLGRWCPTSA